MAQGCVYKVVLVMDHANFAGPIPPVISNTDCNGPSLQMKAESGVFVFSAQVLTICAPRTGLRLPV